MEMLLGKKGSAKSPGYQSIPTDDMGNLVFSPVASPDAGGDDGGDRGGRQGEVGR